MNIIDILSMTMGLLSGVVVCGESSVNNLSGAMKNLRLLIDELKKNQPAQKEEDANAADHNGQ